MLFQSMWGGPAKTDEEYRQKLKARQKCIPVLAIAGAAAIVVSYFLQQQGDEKAFVAGLYMGLGSGILAVGIVLFFKIRSILKDEKKLRERRLKEWDERNIQVTLKAHYTAGLLLILAGYATMLVAGFFSMEVFWTVWVAVMLYFALFLIGKVIYDKRM